VISYRVALWAAGILLAGLLAVFVPLTMASHDLHLSAAGATPVMARALAAAGMVVANRQPSNPIGWLLLGSGLATMLSTDAGLYVLLDYRIGHGTLPLGPAAAFWVWALWPLPFLIGTPALVLFPDGQLPTRLSRWSVRIYVATSTLWIAGQMAGAIDAIAGHQIHVDASGITNNPAGLAASVSNLSWVFAVPIPVIWLIWIGHQIVSYRGATDQRREQLKWLTGGAAAVVVGVVVSLLVTSLGGPAAQAALIISRLAIVAFPVSIGVAILKYRLYEIDRLISRTLAYAIVTGLLVGVYAGLTVAAFASRLKDAVDLDSVQEGLADVVSRALEPAHVSVWISRRH
jgi:hypothetical protein